MLAEVDKNKDYIRDNFTSTISKKKSEIKTLNNSIEQLKNEEIDLEQANKVSITTECFIEAIRNRHGDDEAKTIVKEAAEIAKEWNCRAVANRILKTFNKIYNIVKDYVLGD